MTIKQLSLTLVATFFTVMTYAETLYVSKANKDGQKAPYTSWETAAVDIQSAVKEAGADDTILVKPGRYTAPDNAVESAGASNVVYLNKALTLRSTDGAESTIIDGEGENRGLMVDHFTSVQFDLEGFTVTNGKAPQGGGVYLRKRYYRANISDFVITGNTATEGGGGMYIKGPIVTLSGCEFRDNVTQEGAGGALRADGATTVIRDSLLANNRADKVEYQSGGGILFDGGEHEIVNTVLRDNHAADSGNAATGGGAINLSQAQVDMRNCLMFNNSGYRAGGVYMDNHRTSAMTVENCTVTRNKAYSGGSRFGSGGLFTRPGNATMTVYNSIIFENEGGNLNYSDSGGCVAELKYTCTAPKAAHPDGEKAFDADHNISAAPKFAAPKEGDFSLSDESPCINAGNNRDWMADSTDMDGTPRVDRDHETVDMGCYEYSKEEEP